MTLTDVGPSVCARVRCVGVREQHAQSSPHIILPTIPRLPQVIAGFMRGALVCALATFAAGFLVFARSSHDALRDGAAHALQHIGVHLTR